MNAIDRAQEKREVRMRRNLWNKSIGGFTFLKKGKLENAPNFIDIATIREMVRQLRSVAVKEPVLNTFVLVTE